jgi:hypothetical protein
MARLARARGSGCAADRKQPMRRRPRGPPCRSTGERERDARGARRKSSAETGASASARGDASTRAASQETEVDTSMTTSRATMDLKLRRSKIQLRCSRCRSARRIKTAMALGPGPSRKRRSARAPATRPPVAHGSGQLTTRPPEFAFPERHISSMPDSEPPTLPRFGEALRPVPSTACMLPPQRLATDIDAAAGRYTMILRRGSLRNLPTKPEPAAKKRP